MKITGQQILATLGADGTLTVELAPLTLPDPTGSQIAVRVDAAPINPSDLALLFGPSDTDNADYLPGKVVARMPMQNTAHAASCAWQQRRNRERRIIDWTFTKQAADARLGHHYVS